jgi:hypothetical protein
MARAIKHTWNADLLGGMWNFRLGNDPTLIGLRCVAISTWCHIERALQSKHSYGFNFNALLC